MIPTELDFTITDIPNTIPQTMLSSQTNNLSYVRIADTPVSDEGVITTTSNQSEIDAINREFENFSTLNATNNDTIIPSVTESEDNVEESEEGEVEETLDNNNSNENDNMSAVPLNDNSTARYKGAPWFAMMYDYSAAVYGLGGIGSNVALALSRLGLKEICGCDPDTIEEVNLAGQFFTKYDVGYKKALICGNFVRNYSSIYTTVYFLNQRLTENSYLFKDITIGAFDNMEARKVLYNCFKETYVGTCLPKLFIDCRMSAEKFQIFCFTNQPSDEYYRKDYEDNWLFSDSQAEMEVCSYKQTAFVGMVIGGMVANLIVNFITNIASETDTSIFPRPLPYKTFYDASFMNVNTYE